MPTSFDDFSTGFDNFGSYGPSPGSLMGEPRLKLRSPRSKAELVPESPQRRSRSGAQAFGNRYDFNSSLSAAKSHAFAALGEHSGLTQRSDTKQSSHGVPAVASTRVPPPAPLKLETGAKSSSTGVSTSAQANGSMASKPAALVSEKPPLTSQSYQELVDKYCFVGAQGKSQELNTLKC